MTGVLAALLIGVALGFSLAAPPGPMNAWIAAVAVRSFRAGVITGIGAMVADMLLGTAVYLLERVVDLHQAVRYVYLLGAGAMAFFGSRLLGETSPPAAEPAELGAFVRALALGLTNPFQIIWWLTAGLAFAYLGGAVLLVGLFGAIVAWIVAYPWAVHAGARRHRSAERVVRWASAAILLGFAGYFAVLFALAVS